MAKKHVKSTDPRKAQIVAALKRKSGGGKVTLVTEDVGPITGLYFQGSCMRKLPGGRGAGYEDLGVFQVTAKEAGLSKWED